MVFETVKYEIVNLLVAKKKSPRLTNEIKWFTDLTSCQVNLWLHHQWNERIVTIVKDTAAKVVIQFAHTCWQSLSSMWGTITLRRLLFFRNTVRYLTTATTLHLSNNHLHFCDTENSHPALETTMKFMFGGPDSSLQPPEDEQNNTRANPEQFRATTGHTIESKAVMTVIISYLMLAWKNRPWSVLKSQITLPTKKMMPKMLYPKALVVLPVCFALRCWTTVHVRNYSKN